MAAVAAGLALASFARGSEPWFQDYFTVYTMPHRASDAAIQETGADAQRASVLWGGWYGAWYDAWQKTTPFYRKAAPRMQRLFRRNLMYYDGGEVGDFVLFLDADGQVASDGWSLPTWKGHGPITAHWFGMDAFFKRTTPFPFPNYEKFGLAPFTDPSGKVPKSVYEVLGWRDVNGKGGFNLRGSNAAISDELARTSGLSQISRPQSLGQDTMDGNGWVISRLVTQDYANPQLRDYEAWDMARLTRELKPDGWHIDNFGDNDLFCPFRYAFGVWSEFTYRQFLGRHFSAAELARLGVPDLAAFDIKAYLRSRRDLTQPTEFGGYNDPKWKDDLLFKCYLVNQAQESMKFHAAKFDAVKQAAAADGRPILMSGNFEPLFPGYSLLAGKVDVAHFEWQTERDYLPTRRPLGLPPAARSGYATRLAAAVSNEHYGIVSLYVRSGLRGPAHENLYLAEAFEALPNRCLLDYGHAYLDMYSPGTPRTAGIYNRFIAQHRRELSRRDFMADLGIVFDQWADVSSLTAAQMDVNDFFNEYGGWCDFCADTHRQWRIVPSVTLTDDSIRRLPLVVLPSAVTLTDANFAVLKTYLARGGHVLATGLTGVRQGPEGYLMRRSRNPLEALRSYPGFRWVTDQPAARYWLGKDPAAAQRMTRLATFPGLEPVVTTDADIPVGVTLSRSLPSEPDELSLDLNNDQFDVASDRFTPTQSCQIAIRLPDDFRPPFQIRVSEPEKATRELPGTFVAFNAQERRLTLKVPSFEYYQLIEIRNAGSARHP